jgi:putative alpha-1,2-mannosidase
MDLSDKNCFIQNAILNGKKIERAWLEHAELIGGGTLILKMGNKPSDWGTRLLPPSELAK